MKTEFKNAYGAGFDAAVNGSNTINCHFSWFKTRESMEEWSRGNKDGMNKRAVKIYASKKIKPNKPPKGEKEK